MRKFYIVCLLLDALLIAVSGCNAKDNTKETNKTETTGSVESKPVGTFIELGSDRCVPCKMMQPIIEEIKQEYAETVQVLFYDVWTEEGRPYGEQYNIRAIPTQIFLDKNGEEYFRHEGYFPKEELEKILKMKL